MNQQLARNISQAYVMSQYLQNLAAKIGGDAYLNSFVRREHGTGTGFFGIGNTGSADCVKERFRGITDHLGQRWDRWQEIQLVSESCLSISNPCFKSTYRVEHTREVIDLYCAFEKEYIISGKPFTENDLARWVITHHLVCLIRQDEQRSRNHYDDLRPFSKYSSKIYYQGQDISDYTLDQLKQLNEQRFAFALRDVENFDFTRLNQKHIESLLQQTKKHTLPPFDIAVKFYSNEYELLDRHYHHKLNKRTNPAFKKYYSAEDARKFNEWKNNEKLRLA